MNKTFGFGKIDYYNRGRKINLVTADARLEAFLKLDDTEKYPRFSVSFVVWNSTQTDCVNFGQCGDTIYPFFKDNTTFTELYDLWKKYHLNDMKLGTHKQYEALIKKFGSGLPDYDTECEYLKSIGLFEDTINSETEYINDGSTSVKFGHKWVTWTIPEKDLARIKFLLG